MDIIPKSNVVHKLAKGKLLTAINCVAALSIFFFGYDQGMMGGVNTSYDYYHNKMKFGHPAEDGTPIIDDGLMQGGIVSIYYLGTLMGCLAGGWFGDRYGRIKTIALGAAWGIFGACLQTSAMNPTWMILGMMISIRAVENILIAISSLDKWLGYWYPQFHCSCLGYRDGRAYLPWKIRCYRVYSKHLWCVCCLLDRVWLQLLQRRQDRLYLEISHWLPDRPSHCALGRRLLLP